MLNSPLLAPALVRWPALAVCAALVLAGGTRADPPGALPAGPVGSKVAAPTARYYLTEDGPTRGLSDRDPARRCWARRDVYPTGEARYFVYLSSVGEGPDAKSQADSDLKLEARDVVTLVELDRKLRGRKAGGPDGPPGYLNWKAVNHIDGREAYLTRPLGPGAWERRVGSLIVTLDGPFVPALEQALKDVEALKSVKPAVPW